MALVSVVMPCFNAAMFLDESISSVVQQTGVDWELIIVDDGSTDNSSAIIHRWQQRLGRQMISLSGPNRGVSYARNAGTEMARGTHIQYLDADDILQPNSLLQKLEALSHGFDVAYCDWLKLVEKAEGCFVEGEVISRTIETVHPRAEIAIFTSFWSPPAALMYTRDIVDSIGGWNETLTTVEDARFLLEAAFNGARFVHVRAVGAHYRVARGASLSTRDPVSFARNCFLNACQVENYWRENGGLDEARRYALIGCYDYVARTFLHSDQPSFQKTLKRLYTLEPRFKVTYPKVGGLLSKVFGQKLAASVLKQLTAQTSLNRCLTWLRSWQ